MPKYIPPHKRAQLNGTNANLTQATTAALADLHLNDDADERRSHSYSNRYSHRQDHGGRRSSSSSSETWDYNNGHNRRRNHHHHLSNGAPYDPRTERSPRRTYGHEQRRAMEQKRKEESRQKKVDEKQKEEEGDWDEPAEWKFFQKYFEDNSEEFQALMETKNDGRSNANVERFFTQKKENQDKVSRSDSKNMVSLFDRFLRYAIDIDNGCDFVQEMIDKCNNRTASQTADDYNNGDGDDDVWFLEFGFAPGGMSTLLLCACDSIHGMGLTLPPKDGGNVFPAELDRHRRFEVRLTDVTLMTRNMVRGVNTEETSEDDCREHVLKHVRRAMELPRQVSGFDFSIVGITIHQSFESNREKFDRLDHQILFSELLVTFGTLRHGGNVLIRHKIALDLIHHHLMYVFLQCFSSYRQCKPLTEFSMRKTFWILWCGYDEEKGRELGLVNKLITLLQQTHSGYAYNNEENCYFNPILCDLDCDGLVESIGTQYVEVMTPMWHAQAIALKEFCDGLSNQICRRSNCAKGTRGCSRAHCEEECISGLVDAITKVDDKLFYYLEEHARKFDILRKLYRRYVQ